MTKLRPILKRSIQRGLTRLLGKHVVFLPKESADDGGILHVVTNYRMDASPATVFLLEPTCGRLSATLLGYEGHYPSKAIWSGVLQYCGPSELTLDLAEGTVRLGDRAVGGVPLPLPGRRFCWQLDLAGTDGRRRRRLTGHYVPGSGRPADQSYFQGDNYVNYESQSEAEAEKVLALACQHDCRSPVLEVGCATGRLLEVLGRAGFRSVGVDICNWAVEQARQRVGAGRAFCCDVETEPLPDAVAGQGPFSTLVLWAVLEHFRDPFGVLARLSQHAAPRARLVLGTTNADSLTRHLFAGQWEGHVDWTHHGVQQVGVRSLRERLPALGWRIDHLSTDRVWDCNADPTRATLREWWAADARFRRLLAERDLGDLITCVAGRDV